MSGNSLVELLQGTVSGRSEEMRRCERTLEIEKQSAEFPLRLLELVASDSVAAQTRLAGAIYLKNTVKQQHTAHAAAVSGPIKDVIVKVLLQVPRPLQSQLAAMIGNIAEAEFPVKWENLLPQLDAALQTSDEVQILGALECVNAVLDKYRTLARSEDVLRQMQFILKHFQHTHLRLFKTFVSTLLSQSGGKLVSQTIVELLCSIFQSMNSVDIPEYYQDNLSVWMQGFCALLAVPCSTLKTQVCENLTLYADKYQEPFEPFVLETVKTVWTLLKEDDELVTVAALKFLASAASTNWQAQCNPFADAQALRVIVEQAILPNMQLQLSDEELFEDNPREYIARDIEGADQDTRRRAALDLVRSIARFHEAEVTSLLLTHAQSLLGNWRAKETCLHVMASLAIKGQTRGAGVTRTNDQVTGYFTSFFQTHLVSELADPNVDTSPILRASILKFMTLFRHSLNLKLYAEMVGRHLAAKHEVLFTYAAHALCHAVDATTNAELVRTWTATLVRRLLSASTPNEYAMKLFVVLAQFVDQQTLTEATQILPNLLTKILADPVSPTYTHHLFETVAVAISRATAVDQILAILVDGILAKNLVDFLPYAFQLLALILRKHNKGDTPPVFANLFPLLLSEQVWTQSACVPAVVQLLAAYFAKPGNLFSTDAVQNVLAKLQTLLRTPKTEPLGLELLAHLCFALPLPLYQTMLAPLLTFLLTELRDRRTERKVRGFAVAMAAFILTNGAGAWRTALESIQPGLFTQVFRGLFLTPLPDLPSKVQRKVCVVALCRVAGEMQGEDLENIFSAANALVTKIATGVSSTTEVATAPQEDPEITAESFEGQFVRLRHAAGSDDFAASVADEWTLLKTTLKPMVAKCPSAQHHATLVQWLLV